MMILCAGCTIVVVWVDQGLDGPGGTVYNLGYDGGPFINLIL